MSTGMRVICLLSFLLLSGSRVPDALAQHLRVIEDFEAYNADDLPFLWKIPDRRSKSMRPLPPDHAKSNDFVNIVAEESGKVLRAYTQGESVQIALPRGDGLDWDLDYFPRLRWRWKADKLPVGAREDKRKRNDTGAALYVAFGCNDWLGRPCTIKYTYSSTLPRETQSRYGKLHVLVVSTATEITREWIEVERNVLQDYVRLFGKPPPGDPLYIVIWNDSDNTNTESDVYFDDIVVITEE